VKLSLYENPLEKVLKKALEVLKGGGIVAYPTETFYGLAVVATNEEALRRLYELKNRPTEKAMPVIVGSREVLESIVKSIPLQAEVLIERFWPGPLTIVFDAIDGLSKILTGGTDKVAVRIPGESFALNLAMAADFPITATSANLSGMPPAEDATQVMNYLGEAIDLIIDGGKTPGGKPSTIVDVTVTPLKVLREGKIPFTLLNP